MQQSIVALLSLSALALGAPTIADDSTKVALPKRHSVTRSNGAVDATRFLSHLNSTVQKYSGKSLKTYATGATDLVKRQA